jgi:hypothetical protein
VRTSRAKNRKRSARCAKTRKGDKLAFLPCVLEGKGRKVKRERDRERGDCEQRKAEVESPVSGRSQRTEGEGELHTESFEEMLSQTHNSAGEHAGRKTRRHARSEKEGDLRILFLVSGSRRGGGGIRFFSTRAALPLRQELYCVGSCISLPNRTNPLAASTMRGSSAQERGVGKLGDALVRAFGDRRVGCAGDWRAKGR